MFKWTLEQHFHHCFWGLGGVSSPSIDQKVTSSIPGQGSYPGVGSVPGQGMHMRDNQSASLSHQYFSLPPNLSLSFSLSLFSEAMKRMSLHEDLKKTHTHRQHHGDYQREREVERDKIMGDKWWLGWWGHNTIYRWCIMELYTWNLYNFVNVTQINSIKKRKKK